MAKPYILSVDDDAQVVNAVVRDLRSRYAEDYQIIQAQSGEQALEAVEQLSSVMDRWRLCSSINACQA